MNKTIRTKCERINLDVQLKTISKHICNYYSIGEYISEDIVKAGFEDLNYILATNNGKQIQKYFIKIFNKNKTKKNV